MGKFSRIAEKQWETTVGADVATRRTIARLERLGFRVHATDIDRQHEHLGLIRVVAYVSREGDTHWKDIPPTARTITIGHTPSALDQDREREDGQTPAR